MDIVVKKVLTDPENKNIVYWSIEDNGVKLLAEVNYVDIYSAGYVYDITVYCPEFGTKINFYRVKSYRSLLEDEAAARDYFSDECDLCANLSDFGYCSRKLLKRDRAKVEKILS